MTKYPTEYVKTRKQLLKGGSSDSILRLVATTIRSSGIRVLYTGASAFCVSNASKSGVRFLTFDAVRGKLPKDERTGKATAASTMLAGVAAGMAESVTVVTPGEKIKTAIVEDRAGPRRFKSTRDAIANILRTNGVTGFFRGVVPVTMKQGSNALVRFTSYSFLLDVAKPRFERAGIVAWAPAVAGAMAGIITVYATMPFDVVKTMMQARGVDGVPRGSRESVAAILRDSGIAGLWRGTTPRLVRLSVRTQ